MEQVEEHIDNEGDTHQILELGHGQQNGIQNWKHKKTNSKFQKVAVQLFTRDQRFESSHF